MSDHLPMAGAGEAGAEIQVRVVHAMLASYLHVSDSTTTLHLDTKYEIIASGRCATETLRKSPDA